MRFNIEERKQIHDWGKFQYVKKYHDWLEKEREKDRKKIPINLTNTSGNYLAKGLCPYCKEKIDIEEHDGMVGRVCKKHGLLSIKKKEWKIWSADKKYERKKA